MKKVSIIIPVYNVEDYLEECLVSIVHQSIGLKNIEVIIINDGSKDNSMKILHKYQKKYPDWIIINRENRGLSATRNEAMKLVNTPYVMFLDSDDYLDKSTLKEMYDIIIKENSDMVIGRMKSFDTKGFYGYYFDKVITKYETVTLKEKKKLIKLISVCCKLYKKELINDIEFPNNLRHEDNYFSVSVFMKVNKITLVPKYYYYRRFREGENISFMQNLSIDTFYDLVKNYDLFFQNNVENSLVIHFSLRMFSNYIITRLPKKDQKLALIRIKEYLKNLQENNKVNKITYLYYCLYQKTYYRLAKIYYPLRKLLKHK